MESADKVARYRAEMANLLAKSVATTRELERWLDFTGGWDEATVRFDLAGDETSTARVQSALLLRKARVHSDAVLQANETNNLHSLAVQMRPVLECAGQVVFLFHNMIIAPGLTMKPEHAAKVVGDYISADYYGTLIRATKGKIGHKELLENIWSSQEDAAASAKMPEPQRAKGKSLKHADKVAPLAGSKNWYSYLSEHFCHGRADWRGHSWRGGVASMNSARDQFTFASLIHYLVEQVGVMNVYAGLCPVAGNDGHDWAEDMLARLCEAREISKAAREAAVPAFSTETRAED